MMKRNEFNRPKRVVGNRNTRRMHLQCEVKKGGAKTAKEEHRLRSLLGRLLKREKLTGRRYTRLVEKHRRAVS